MKIVTWFATEYLDHGTTAISEYGHWEQVHSYLFEGSRKAALIDTGMPAKVRIKAALPAITGRV